MSDPKPAEPDEELLEFLGSIDEVNDETADEDLTGLLGRTELEKPDAGKSPPAKEEKSE